MIFLQNTPRNRTFKIFLFMFCFLETWDMFRLIFKGEFSVVIGEGANQYFQPCRTVIRRLTAVEWILIHLRCQVCPFFINRSKNEMEGRMYGTIQPVHIANFSSYETVRHERVTSCIIYLWGIKFVLKILVNFLTIFINFLTISQTTFLSFFIISSTLPVLHERNQCSAANSIVPYCFIYLIFDSNICLNNDRDPWQSFCMCHKNAA